LAVSPVVIEFEDHGALARVAFDDTTFERARFVRESVAAPFVRLSVDRMEPTAFWREIDFWQRYTRTMKAVSA
jgi:hypothetical protein